jgi:CTP:molybdopterin cytidylyltransferase MocA
MANPALACRARHEDYAGPPVILPAASFDDASKLTGDQGARQLLARLGAGQLTDVEMPSALYDLDLPAQLPEFNDSPSDVG